MFTHNHLSSLAYAAIIYSYTHPVASNLAIINFACSAIANTNFCAPNYRLNYSSTGYRDAEGVNVTAANFGSTSSVETLDMEKTDLYFFQFVEYFAQHGYKRNVNIRAAPYDYRLGSSKTIHVHMTNCQ